MSLFRLNIYDDALQDSADKNSLDVGFLGGFLGPDGMVGLEDLHSETERDADPACLSYFSFGGGTGSVLLVISPLNSEEEREYPLGGGTGSVRLVISPMLGEEIGLDRRVISRFDRLGSLPE